MEPLFRISGRYSRHISFLLLISSDGADGRAAWPPRQATSVISIIRMRIVGRIPCSLSAPAKKNRSLNKVPGLVHTNAGLFDSEKWVTVTRGSRRRVSRVIQRGQRPVPHEFGNISSWFVTLPYNLLSVIRRLGARECSRSFDIFVELRSVSSLLHTKQTKVLFMVSQASNPPERCRHLTKPVDFRIMGSVPPPRRKQKAGTPGEARRRCSRGA